jgi:ABC-type nitrate/sulfonate/bicarbonate transport system permease component
MSWGDNRRNPRLRWIPWLIGLVFFGTWELASWANIISPLFFPAPSVVIETIVRLFGNGELTENLLTTLARLLSGFLLGSLAGLSLGITMGWSAAARQVLDPVIAAVHPVPKISIFPLIMIVFGIGALSKTIVIAIAAFFPMVINTMAGVRQISPIYFEVASNYGARPWQVFRHVILPGSSPMILAGVRLGLNLSLSITTAIELLMGRNGLGAMIWLSWQTLRIEELYAAIFCLAMIGISIRLLVNFLASHLVPWQEANNRQ